MPVSYRETAPTIRTLPKVLPQDGERAHSVDRTEFDAVAFTALKGIVGQIPGCGRRPRKWFTIAHEIGHSVIPHHLVNQRVRLENENLAAENIVLREHLPENRLYSHKRASDLEDSGIVEVTPQFMAVPLHKLIFDTSAINKIAADVDRDAIIKALGLLYRIGITETAISEIIATEDQTLRKALLDVVKRLLAHGNCIMPFNWIIEEHAKAYQSDSTGYDWKRLNVRVAAAEREVARQEFMHGMSEQTRREMKEWDKQYLNIFRNARPVFQSLLVTSQSRPSVREVTEELMGEGGAHLEIGAGLFDRAPGIRPALAQIKRFIERCPPFRALLVALCFSQYDRCIREERRQSLGKAGRNDMFSAVYLAYCKVFVTSDGGHCKAMKVVAELTDLDTIVLMDDEFKSRLVGLR